MAQMSQCLVFCRTNVDCNALEKYLCAAGGEKWQFSGKKETGKLGKYSCCVLAGTHHMCCLLLCYCTFMLLYCTCAILFCCFSMCDVHTHPSHASALLYVCVMRALY